MKFIKVRSLLDESFKLEFYKKLLVDALRKIICIEKVTVISILEERYSVSTNLDTKPGETESPSVQAELRKLADSLDTEKLTDITKQSSRYPTVAPLLKAFKNNFCIKAKQEYIGEINTLIYVFHFDFQSIRILLEK